MKKLIFLFSVGLFFGCATENCKSKKSIDDYYLPMIAIAEANYQQSGGSHEQVDLLTQEYHNALENRCD